MAKVIAKKLDARKWEKAKAQALERMGGRHSARAMQLATHIYKAMGGRYEGPKTGKESLTLWTKERWRTRPGTPTRAEQSYGTHRYLPERAWKKLSRKEQEATDAIKLLLGGREQHWVRNTQAARAARAARAGRK